jgi:hypothetical protein
MQLNFCFSVTRKNVYIRLVGLMASKIVTFFSSLRTCIIFLGGYQNFRANCCFQLHGGSDFYQLQQSHPTRIYCKMCVSVPGQLINALLRAMRHAKLQEACRTVNWNTWLSE